VKLGRVNEVAKHLNSCNFFLRKKKLMGIYFENSDRI